MKLYTVKHWLATIALGSALVVIYDTFVLRQNSMLSAVQFFFLIFLFGLILSIPVLVLYYVIIVWVDRMAVPARILKITALAFALAGTLFTFHVIGGKLMSFVWMQQVANAR